jgi:hypothetical protein
MRMAVRTIGWLGLALSVGVIALLVAVFVTHPSDEATYLEYIARYGTMQPDVDLPKDTVLDAGHDACRWLATQQPALWRTADHFQLGRLADRYTASSEYRDGLASAGVVTRSMALEAWTHLCPGTRELIEPHGQALHEFFGGSGGD